MAQIIRTAEIKDLPAIAKVHTQSWVETYAGRIPNEVLSQLTYERRLNQWERRLGDQLREVLVLELDGEVVAFSHAVHHPEETLGTEAELASIYALKAHQGRGFGKQLMKASVERLHDAGVKTLGLWVLKDNPTIGFYERMGGQHHAENSMRWFGHDLPVLGYVWKDLSPILNA
ncbi:GNAT family N-acetyltransferase [Deinococcus cellulosilyticus]|uniref:N-acetyltransferase n=1 Tax=Deinococcus cellulosilyticus (strain DSM 18568 / NBRC 106333 / KACC 11606 / 5516J-15) TaxID=1223518 RepID=A0A511MYZ4_DEIC1|nr:GNAT family N-acetyltransferase [Deinococcus cellulosilyticus]GEM45830.1 N-acetyltransferase [Deinococcus cellulosilyticus NBRC 106333 = KACC 11606]